MPAGAGVPLLQALLIGIVAGALACVGTLLAHWLLRRREGEASRLSLARERRDRLRPILAVLVHLTGVLLEMAESTPIDPGPRTKETSDQRLATVYRLTQLLEDMQRVADALALDSGVEEVGDAVGAVVRNAETFRQLLLASEGAPGSAGQAVATLRDLDESARQLRRTMQRHLGGD